MNLQKKRKKRTEAKDKIRKKKKDGRDGRKRSLGSTWRGHLVYRIPGLVAATVGIELNNKTRTYAGNDRCERLGEARRRQRRRKGGRGPGEPIKQVPDLSSCLLRHLLATSSSLLRFFLLSLRHSRGPKTLSGASLMDPVPWIQSVSHRTLPTSLFSPSFRRRAVRQL